MDRVMLNKHRVHEALEANGMTMTDLASEMGTSTANLYNWFGYGFEEKTAVRIARMLKCNIGDLQKTISIRG